MKNKKLDIKKILTKAAMLFQNGPEREEYEDGKKIYTLIENVIMQNPDNWKPIVGDIVKDLLCRIVRKGKMLSPQILNSYQHLGPWEARAGSIRLSIGGYADDGIPYRAVQFATRTPMWGGTAEEALFSLAENDELGLDYFWLSEKLQQLTFERKITKYDVTEWVLWSLQKCMPNEYVVPVQPGVDPWPVPPFSNDGINIVTDRLK